MVWFCYTHKCHSIDDVCTECVREDPRRQLAELQAENEELRREREAYKRECEQWSDCAKDIFSHDQLEARIKAEADRDRLAARVEDSHAAMKEALEELGAVVRDVLLPLVPRPVELSAAHAIQLAGILWKADAALAQAEGEVAS